jgi:hypothetical protein
VVASIVHEQMDQPLAGIHRLDRPQQHDHALLVAGFQPAPA